MARATEDLVRVFGKDEERVYAAREGDIVAVGGMLVTLLAPGETQPAASTSVSASTPLSSLRSLSSASDGHMAGRRTLASPRARRLAAEHGIDLAGIAGHGTNGAVTDVDMSRALAACKTLNAAGCNLSMTDLLLYVLPQGR
jgi:pyruvate/2-oxoglutarate dehydrogenase complex dihydrolipoamide acyltransferase (E2) component